MLRALGLTSELAGYATTADSRLGRVLGVSAGLATVLTEDGPLRAGLGGGLLRSAAADPQQAPCPGDWVLVRDWPDRRVTLERVLPRHTALRADLPDGPVVAANAELVGVVVGPGPGPSPGGLRRLLARAVASGASPVLVATGAGDDPRPVRDRLAALVAGCGSGPVQVVALDARTGTGVPRLRALVDGRTLALVGARTSDRAAVCRALVGADVVGPPALLPLPGGGAVLDADAVAPMAPGRG